MITKTVDYPFQDCYLQDADGFNIMSLDEAFAHCGQNPWFLGAISNSTKTYELCLFCAKTAGETVNYCRNILQDVPEKFRTYELCLCAIERNALALDCVPKHIIDYNICVEAVTRRGEALCSVPQELRNYDLCKLAVENDGEAFFFVPSDLRTHELYDIAISQPKSRHILEVIPIDTQSLR